MTDAANPLLSDWTGPHALPPFELIETSHFRPASEAALSEARAEIDAIATCAEAPDFANTIEALERSGARLDRVAAAFFTIAATDSTPELEAIQSEIAPQLARFHSEVTMNAKLFERIDALRRQEDSLGLTAEQKRLLMLTHRGFTRSGAQLTGDARARMGEIMARLAELGVAFSQNVLADERGWSLDLGADDLAGLPGFLRDAAAGAARERGRTGWTITLSRSLIEPFLQFSERRDLREIAFRAWTDRGARGGETDTAEIVRETLALRRERAQLLGFEDFSRYKLDTEMARTPEQVEALLMRVWAPARARAAEEAESLRAMIRESGANHELAAWDWRFYAEKLRARAHDFSETELKPYLPLERIADAAFAVAGRLFGLSFSPIEGATLHHPDAKAWEVTRDGAHVGVFVADYFNRPGKRSGAWCSNLRRQSKLDGEKRAVAVNVMNFAKAGDGPALLTFDDAETLFHEFGHALHVLLSDVTYPSLSGTAVARDFVELPSQLFEHWLAEPEILRTHAKRADGEAMPEALLEKLLGARNFNQGFSTVEYLASALVDLALHRAPDGADPASVEREVLATLDMPAEITMRHATPHFQHVFSGDGYAAGYYSYMWSEVMDADAFAAFVEAGDAFDAETARRLEAEILSVGGSRDADEAWRAFRGRAPDPQAMLRQRGLAA